MSNAVFLSYASQDAAAAERVAQALRAAGIEVWFDKSELRGGDQWDRRIRQQIRECALFVPLISGHTQLRLEGYFRREWKLAADRTQDMADERSFLLPVVIDDTSERGAAVPEKFHDVQWTWLPQGHATSDFVERVRTLLSVSTQKGPLTPEQRRSAGHSQTLPPPPRGQRNLRAAIGIALALLLVAGIAGWRFLQPAPTAQDAHPAQPVSVEPGAEKNIAVLPFVDLSEKHDQEYFADGMAEDLIDLLAKLPGLQVIGRGSSFQFRGQSLDVRSIGSTLHARYLLEGSVRRAGEQVRVTVRLLSAEDGRQLWSAAYDSKLDDVLQVQNAVATSLARSLQLAVDSLQSATEDKESTETHDLFIRGREAIDEASKEGCERAVGLFTRLTQLEPTSSRASSYLALAYEELGEEGWMLPGEAFKEARKYAQRALQLDPRAALAHVVLAQVHLIYDWQWPEAQQEIELALAGGNPDSRTLVVAAQIASVRGQFDQAERLLGEALAIDPLDPNAYEVLGYSVYLREGRDAEAERPLRRALQIRATYGTAHYFLAVCLLMQGKLPEAMAEAQQEQPEDGKYHALSEVFFALHRKADSDQALEKAIKASEKEWPVSLAKVYAYRGQFDQALLWLNRAYQFHDEDLYFSKGDPQFRNLEGDPRYKAFLRKMNLQD